MGCPMALESVGLGQPGTSVWHPLCPQSCRKGSGRELSGVKFRLEHTETPKQTWLCEDGSRGVFSTQTPAQGL